MTRLMCAMNIALLMLFAGCSGSDLGERLSTYRDVLPAKFQKSEDPVTRALGATWDIQEAPVRFLNNRSAEHSSQDVRISGRAIMYVEDHAPANSYQVSWTGLRPSHAEAPTVILVKDKSGNTAIELRFEGPRLRVITAVEDEFPQLTYSSAEPHDIALTVSIEPVPTVAIDITQNGRPIYTTPPILAQNAGFSGFDGLEVAVASDEASYVMTDLMVRPAN